MIAAPRVPTVELLAESVVPRNGGCSLRGPEAILRQLVVDDNSGGAAFDPDGGLVCVLTQWRFWSDTLFALLLVGCFIPFQVVLPMARTSVGGLVRLRGGLIFVHGVRARSRAVIPQLLGVGVPASW